MACTPFYSLVIGSHFSFISKLLSDETHTLYISVSSILQDTCAPPLRVFTHQLVPFLSNLNPFLLTSTFKSPSYHEMLNQSAPSLSDFPDYYSWRHSLISENL